MTTDRPISWMALKEGTKVRSSDGKELGSVTAVVADVGNDIFSGISFRDGLFGPERFAPADAIADITPDEVALSIDSGAADGLEPPS